MAEQKSIKKNIFMKLLLVSSNYFFPIITFGYVSRTLMPDGLGIVAFVQAVLSYFSYIAFLGIPAYGVRECAKIRDDKEQLSHTFWELIMINLISTAFAYICLVAVLLVVPRLMENRMLFILMSTSIILKVFGVEWLYEALEEYSYITVRSLIVKCISVLLTFLLIRDKDDYIWYGMLAIFASSASNICNLIRIRKYISFKRPGKYDLHKHLKPIFSLFSASIIISIYANFDVVMIGLIKNDSAVGLYNAALKIKNIMLITATAVADTLIPRVSYYFNHQNRAEIQKLAVKTVRFSMLSTVPVAIYVLLYAENVLQFVCGSAYAGAAPTLRVLSLCVFPLTFTYLFGQQLLIPMEMEKRYSQSVFVGLWINLALNLLMIPFMGSFGAAIGTLVTECWNAYWMSGGVKDYRRYILKKTIFSKYIVALVLGAVASVTVFYIISDLNVFLQLLITALMFFCIYYLLLLLYREPAIWEIMAFIKKKLIKGCI